MALIVGVDPGQRGAIALLDESGQLVRVHDMPSDEKGVSVPMMVDLEDWGGLELRSACIEDVHSMPRQGVASTFKFGRSKGAVEMLFGAHHVPLAYVSPSKWKRVLAIGADKAASRRRAMDLWPGFTSELKLVRHDGRAEAALIAYWHWRHNLGGAT